MDVQSQSVAVLPKTKFEVIKLMINVEIKILDHDPNKHIDGLVHVELCIHVVARRNSIVVGAVAVVQYNVVATK